MRRLFFFCAAALLCARAFAEEAESEPAVAERREALKAIFGDPPPAARIEWMRIAAQETSRPRLRAALTFDSGALEWVNVGPSDAVFEKNGVAIPGVDSGRPNTILVDPRDPEVVYVATAGGGIWKTWNFLSGFPGPAWISITDAAPDLSIGALALDPQAPDTLYAGLGDFDSNFHSAAVMKSVDGGATWSAPVTLGGTYPASSGGFISQPLSVRDVKVDPGNSSVVYVATDFGLYQSTTAGASFTLVDLPNSGTQVSEATWSIAVSGGAVLVSGVGACSGQIPPWVGGGGVCNVADVWRSTNAGTSWTSLAGAGALPNVADFGRVSLASAQGVVYAFVANADETSSVTRAIWRSNDSGATWADATGTLANPTALANGRVDCGDMNLGHDQSDYNQSVVVDPQNPDHVVIGGNFCAARTLNGTAASPIWENVAHWLPLAGGSVAGGTLPYVHADWHAGTAVAVDGVTRVFAGTDGGVFSSANVFDAATLPAFVTWTDHNRGLTSHLCYSVASGDPADGNPLTVFTGLQDNGTRFRDATASTSFNQRIGGDGIGAAVTKGSAGEFWWASLQRKHFFCAASAANCLDVNNFNWAEPEPALSGTDANPFFIDYAPVRTDPSGQTVLTNTRNNVWKSVFPGPSWAPLITQSNPWTYAITHVVASPTVASLFGAVGGNDRAVAVTSGGGWTFSSKLGAAGITLWTPATSLDFPPVTPAGTAAGDVFVASSAAAVTDRGALVPATVGHLFKTVDRGTTWSPLHGNGTGADLPNVPIYVVRYDPADSSGNTIYVGTLFGVYRTTDGGNTWARFGTGLPHVAITGMFIAKGDTLLRVSTWGRGIWEIYPDSTAAGGVRGDGDSDRNLVIDFTDVAALASRMGTTPATPGWPTYSHTLDLAGTANSIDDADLSALLAKLGEHP